MELFYQLKQIEVTSNSPADKPCSMWLHTSTPLLNTNIIVVFGGVKTSGGSGFCDDNAQTYDVNNKKWNRIEISGVRPQKRQSHAATSPGEDRLLVHGGQSTDQNEISSLWELNLRTKKWTELGKDLEKGKTCPTERVGHFMAFLQHIHKVILGFGQGRDDKGKLNQQLNDLWQLNLDATPDIWLKISCDWQPEARRSMAVAIQPNSIILHEGEGKNRVKQADSFQLSIKEEKKGLIFKKVITKGIWSKLTEPENKIGRCGHQADLIGKDIFIFTGGGEDDNQSTLLYHNQKWYDGADLKLSEHTTWSDGKQIFVFGGEDQTNDIYEIQLDKIFGDNPEALLLLDNFKYFLNVRYRCNKISKYHKMKYHLLRYIQEQGYCFD